MYIFYLYVILILLNLYVAWISSDYFESLLLPQLRGENDSKLNRMNFRLILMYLFIYFTYSCTLIIL